MTTARCNIHATAIVTGTTGLLFVGPSGCGKSALALACMASTRRAGQFSALVADDQVFITVHNDRVVATRPETTRGLVEVRGVGIVETESISAALMDYAVQPIDLATAERLPPEGQRYHIVDNISLPLVLLPADSPDPVSVLAAFIPALRF
ncbi:HPr kinase/phosphorylase [Rhizobiaceae bacterium n13]|uniref:HPr kinase/phosphorylase n=1 Tax=Ferirhizobium litorale TaxID=2927786 RepID=A0AAE3U338_9HYPH|nr:HPr kinase/phosphorylase [Fererhizobium litorale]MDI7863016.1 HPr kinase/phosphorylase [Fererhizobium litorale]MDI7923307.1 HPr kinase/phosphorylase [Fererhizobium litorale]